jgi:ribosome recycling factor
MTEEILLDAEDRMDKAVTALTNTLDTIRTGARARRWSSTCT